jgi:hypothetical protein
MPDPDPVDVLRRDGPRRHAGWDPAVFDAVAAGPAAALADALGPSPDGRRALAGWLRLVEEGVGRGHLRRGDAGPDGWSNFLERCVLSLLPSWLPALPAADRLPLLATAWNLGEGLLREPAWVDRYVGACAGNLTGPADLEAFLVRTLGPVLEPAPPATWAGPFAVSVVDLRAAFDEFLPGPMWLAAPAVLCVRDRRRPEWQAGVLLRRGGASQLIGPAVGLGEYPEETLPPALEVAPNRLTVAGQPVELPRLGRPLGHRVAAAGFVAVTAVDSQRLWVVESAA